MYQTWDDSSEGEGDFDHDLGHGHRVGHRQVGVLGLSRRGALLVRHFCRRPGELLPGHFELSSSLFAMNTPMTPPNSLVYENTP